MAHLALENVRFSSLFAAGDVSRNVPIVATLGTRDISSAVSGFCQVFIVFSANNENSHRTREKPLVPRVHCCNLMWHIVVACSSLWIGSRIFLELDTYLYLYLKSCVPWFTSKFLCFRVVSERRLTLGVPKWQPIWTRFKIMVIVIIKRAWCEWRKEFHKNGLQVTSWHTCFSKLKKMFNLIFKFDVIIRLKSQFNIESRHREVLLRFSMSKAYK